MEILVSIVYIFILVVLFVFGVYDQVKYYKTGKVFLSSAFYAFASIGLLFFGLGTLALAVFISSLAQLLFVYSMILLILSGACALALEWR